MKILRTLGSLVVAGAVVGAVVAALPAGAAQAAGSGDTIATFTLSGGSLDITSAPNAALTNGAPGDASVAGSLGAVGVSDTRGSAEGWGVSASSTRFVDGAGPVSTGVQYNSGPATATTGTVAAISTGNTDITAEAPVASGIATGNNTATYDPTLTVFLPTNALAGDYSGTVTTSVL